MRGMQVYALCMYTVCRVSYVYVCSPSMYVFLNIGKPRPAITSPHITLHRFSYCTVVQLTLPLLVVVVVPRCTPCPRRLASPRPIMMRLGDAASRGYLLCDAKRDGDARPCAVFLGALQAGSGSGSGQLVWGVIDVSDALDAIL